MKRFNFRLEKLLEIRRYREREWELKLAHITGICVKLQWEIRNIAAERKRAFSLVDAVAISSVDYLKARELYIRRLEQNGEDLARELARKEEEREKIRREYQEVSKNRKILEKLKEKRAWEDYKNQRDEEIKSVDDINMSNYTRK